MMTDLFGDGLTLLDMDDCADGQIQQKDGETGCHKLRPPVIGLVAWELYMARDTVQCDLLIG